MRYDWSDKQNKVSRKRTAQKNGDEKCTTATCMGHIELKKNVDLDILKACDFPDIKTYDWEKIKTNTDFISRL